jgi:hypothetical protein
VTPAGIGHDSMEVLAVRSDDQSELDRFTIQARDRSDL